MKKYIIIVLFIGISSILSCEAQKNEISTMMEKYDFSLMPYFEETKTIDTVIKKHDTLILVTKMSQTGAYYNEYSPAPQFYAVHKQFHPNGLLKSKVMFVGSHIGIGESIYYDEHGKVIKKVDEDAKFGKIKPDWILEFIDQKGWIDLKTGRGREEIAFTEQGRGYIKNGIFELTFYKEGEYPLHHNDYPLWFVIIPPTQQTNYYRTVYQIHGETGEVLYEETKQVLKRE